MSPSRPIPSSSPAPSEQQRLQSDSDPSSPPIPGLIGSGLAMQDVYRMTRRIARSNAAVLLTGETGTGKELIAKALHRLSDRGSGPFVRVNCGALAENLLESELFGHVRGAFTGAFDHRTGRFEAAHGGTLFLDEINSTSPMLQVKLLRVLQEHEFERVGDTETIHVDVRVITASNQDLLAKSETEEFREDLYYRLNVLSVDLPPLRKRREDIPELVAYFLDIFSKKNGRYVSTVEPEAMRLFQAYDWPGNVRELQNYIERGVVLAMENELTADLLPDVVWGRKSRRPNRRAGTDIDSVASELVQLGLEAAAPNEDALYSKIVNRVERELIAQVMDATDNVRTKAAARLGINRNTLHKKLQEHGLDGATK